MTKIRIISVVIVFASINIISADLRGQDNTPKKLITMEFGPAFSGSGDMLGRLLNVEYGRGLSNKFALGFGVHTGVFPGGTFNNDFKEEHKIRSVDLNTYFFPLAKSKSQTGFFISPGINVRQWNSFYQTGIINGFTLSGVPIEPNTIVREQMRMLGYNLLLGYRFKVTESFVGQIRMGVQNDFYGNIVSAIRFGAGYRF